MLATTTTPTTHSEDEKIETATVLVPRVLHWDLENNILIQENAGKKSTPLKEFISSLTHPPSPRLAKDIGSSLGEFIAHLHLYGFRHRKEL